MTYRSSLPATLRRGFTLIELPLVLVILGVLAAVVVPKLAGHAERSRITAAKTDISNLESALDQFQLAAGRYPTNDEGVGALINSPSNVKDWAGPYVKQIPNDPWGHPYIYNFPGSHNTRGFDLSSPGPDGQDGTSDDLDNWSQK